MALNVNTDKQKVYTYTIKSERKSENPFTVGLRRVPLKELMTLNDKLVVRHESQIMYMANDYYKYNIAKLGIVEWNNIVDDKGEQVKLIKDLDGLISDKSLDMLSEDIVKEVAEVIVEISKDPASIQILFGDEQI